jgi:hypothetical protein
MADAREQVQVAAPHTRAAAPRRADAPPTPFTQSTHFTHFTHFTQSTCRRHHAGLALAPPTCFLACSAAMASERLESATLSRRPPSSSCGVVPPPPCAALLQRY